jgi:hypothetical protein
MVDLPIMNTVRELVDAYDEYVFLLGEAEGRLLMLALAHGFGTPDSLVVRGEELRKRIADLKSEIPSLSPTK